MQKRYTADITGATFGHWTVLRKADAKSSNGSVLWECRCSCGTVRNVCESSLYRGKSTGCGCHRRLKNKLSATTHGLSKSAIYKIWQGIKDRCCNPSHVSYANYGGRGITVCQQWKDSFENFYLWAIDSGYRNGLTIDRINNDEGYMPSNCRWSTPLTQANNKRNNHVITYNGKTMTIAQWSKFLGVTPACIVNRITRGETDEEAVSTGSRKRR